MRMNFKLKLIVPLMMLCACGSSVVKADRTIFSPTGETIAPNGLKTQFAISGESKNPNRTWLQYGSPGGIEIELERLDLSTERKKGYALNLQYPITPSLTRAIPAVSFGVRDLFGTSNEHGSFYFAVSKTAGLSDNEYKILKEVKFNFGVGTGRIAGLFIGAQFQFKNRMRFSAEVYERKVNVDATIPLISGFDAKVYSLNNHIFYGFSYNFSK